MKQKCPSALKMQYFRLYQVSEVCIHHSWRQSKWAADKEQMAAVVWEFIGCFFLERKGCRYLLSVLDYSSKIVRVFGKFWILLFLNCCTASRERSHRKKKQTRQSLAIKRWFMNSSWIKIKVSLLLLTALSSWQPFFSIHLCSQDAWKDCIVEIPLLY